MFANIQKLIKKNMRFIFFAILIVFAGFSFWGVKNQNINTIDSLVDHIDKIYGTVDTSFRQYAEQSIILQNNVSSFDSSIQNFTTLSSRIDTLKNRMPNEKNTKEYQTVRAEAFNFLRIAKSITSEQIASLERYKNLTSLSQDYAALRSPFTTKTQLIKSLDAWKKNLDVETAEVARIQIGGDKTYMEDKIAKQRQALEKVENYAKTLPETLSSVQQGIISAALEGIYFENTNSFPRIDIVKLQTPEYGKALKAIQQAVDKLKSVENIQ
jgi:hypothetical protein